MIAHGRIALAGCILPLTLRTDLPEGVGTRHRAAVGMTEESDAVVIVVSEESGAISVAMGGEMTPNLDAAAPARGAARLPLARPERARRADPARGEPGARDAGCGGDAAVTGLVDLRYALLALVAAVLLWGFSQSTASVERGFDVPIVTVQVPEDLILVDRSSDAVNLRVRGSRGALRRIPVADLEYEVDLSGARPGPMLYEVDVTALDLGRGTQIVSRSPTTLEFTLERKRTRRLPVKPDVVGTPGEGFLLGEITADPRRVSVSGAENEVLRLGEVPTETIDVTGAVASFEKEVGAVALGQHVWLDPETKLEVRVEVVPEPPPPPPPTKGTARKRGGR